ncbi:ATP-binding protein [Desulfobacula sp.]|uniref:ATP-binding protein n=1 Tax=Desulfobacula sp. TaxID=2593537 RepID=UPI002619FF55|nr:ATP-binding protein [Desulfobacula sp.]
MEILNTGSIWKLDPTLSQRYKRPGTEKNSVMIVALTALIFVAASAVMSQWSIREMSKIVRRQFNEEQMVIAHNVKNFIEREFSFLIREMENLSNELERNEDPEREIQSTLAHVIESGISKIEFHDRDAGIIYTGYPFHKEIARSPIEAGLSPSLDLDSGKIKQVTVSKLQITPAGIFIILALPVGHSGSRLLGCHVNVSWLLGPYLKNIKSGQTGYAWIIDGAGRFLFHPDISFVGKNAFFARKEKYQDISFVEINKIQRQEMLKGREGTGWYISGWHRGLVGRMEKLIAYTSVTISNVLPQQWSIAVVAPVFEIEEAVKGKYMHQFFMQLVVIFTIIAGASIILFFEMKWSRHMENEVNRQTEAVVKSEAKYRSLVESAEDFIFTVDPYGKFQSMNSFTSIFFKCRAEDYMGKGLSSLFPKKMSNSLQPLIRDVFERGKSIRKEFRLDLDGVQIVVDANMVPVRSETSDVTSVLCIARDITEDKKLERHLIHTEKLASLGVLAAGIAHEINNPLGVILGFSDLMLRKKDKFSQDYRDLKIIERQGLHCKEIVENLLGFVRTGEDHNDRQTDLNRCLEDAIRIVKHRFDKEGISLSTEFPDTIPMVKGDSRKLQQVFLNLINNAADAMPQGGGLAIRTFMDTHLHMVAVQFQDDGVAIEDKDIAHIFEPFFTTKPDGKGTGLGLFVSYGIITGLGGIMECETRKPVPADTACGGTIFTVKLMAIS